MISAQLLTVYGKQNNFTPAVKFSSPSALWLRLRRRPSPESLRDVPYNSKKLGSAMFFWKLVWAGQNLKIVEVWK